MNFIKEIGLILLLASMSTVDSRELFVDATSKDVRYGEYVILRWKGDVKIDEVSSVTWFFDGLEFFTYPKDVNVSRPESHINLIHTNMTQIMIERFRFQMEGNYECRITVNECKTYTAVSQYIRVVDPPNSDQVIHVENDRYKVGDTLNATCEIGKSRPASQLAMYANGHMMSHAFYTVNDLGNHTHSTRLGVSHVISQQDFVDGKIVISCVAKIYTAYENEVNTEVSQSEDVKEKPQKVQAVAVPNELEKGGSTLLICQHDIEKDIYGVKWYKKQREIYRYIVQDSPPQRYFPMDGVHINMSQSTQNQIMLMNVEPKTSGDFTCELSLEAPSFQTWRSSAKLTVMVVPKDKPALEIENGGIYGIGDKLTGTCDLKSYLGVKLMVFINGIKVDSTLIHKDIDEESIMSTANFSIKLERRHFNNNTSTISCVGELGKWYKENSSITIVDKWTQSVPIV